MFWCLFYIEVLECWKIKRVGILKNSNTPTLQYSNTPVLQKLLMTPQELRAQIATGKFNRPTSGCCEGYIQANLVALPERYAADFEAFCRQNPKPCPILEIVGPGELHTRRVADGADLRDTLPRYKVWRNGISQAEVTDIHKIYREDLVFFLLGCSFSFEAALMRAGILLRHVEEGKNVAMYDTILELDGVGSFQGDMVVSMRPIRRERVVDACLVSAHYPEVHGAPVHIGYPEMIGIADIMHPDYGDSVKIMEDEIPVFWACGVTPQNILRRAKLPFAITHAPGHMFVADLRDEDFYQEIV